MDEDDRARLVQCITEGTQPSTKKRKAPEISPVDEGDASGTPLSRQPLVSIDPPSAVMTSMHYMLGGDEEGGCPQRHLVRHLQEAQGQPPPSPVAEDGKRKKINQLSIKEKRDLLRVDQMKMLTGELKVRDGIIPNDVKYIVPKSAAMKALVLRINDR